MRQDIRVGHRHGLLRKVPGTVILLAVFLITARFRIMVIAWTLFGMLDLISAVTLGVLASGTPIGLLAGDVSARVMGQFPLSLIPTFIVPLLFIFHLVSLSRVRKEAVHR